VTHRDTPSSVSFVTGHEDPTKEESAVDWDALAATGGTIVVLMGVGKLPRRTQPNSATPASTVTLRSR